MSYKFPVRMHKTVHKAKLQEESSIDWAALQEKDRREAELKATQESAAEDWKTMLRLNKEKEMSEAYVGADILMKTKLSCLESLSKEVPDMYVSEAFAHAYIDSCRKILDEDYVLEHLEAFRNMAYMYIRKLGGMEYLKEQVEGPEPSPYLVKMYKVCDEAAKKTVEKKSKEIMDAISEEEARDILNGAVKVKDKNDLLDKIDTLGTDQLAELVRNKVVDVVRDEQLREKDEREQRTILKNDLISGEPISASDEGSDEDADSKDDTDADFDEDMGDDDKKSSKKEKKGKKKDKSKDDDEDIEDDEPESDDDDEDKGKKKEKSSSKKKSKKDKDEDSESDDDMGEEPESDEDDDKKDKKKDKKKKKAAKESFFTYGDISNWNPLTESFDYNKDLAPKSLFYAINVAVMRDMVESAAATEGKSFTSTRRNTPQAVMENPLNMDIFMEYLKDNSDGYDVIEKSETHEPRILGSSEQLLDYDKVLTESLVQYTLLECANTMKLINPSEEMVRQQSDYLLGIGM